MHVLMYKNISKNVFSPVGANFFDNFIQNEGCWKDKEEGKKRNINPDHNIKYLIS